MRSVPTVLLLLLFALSAQAADISEKWFAHGRFIEESESQRTTNGLTAKLDFTLDPNFLTNWRQNWTPVTTIKHTGGLLAALFIATDPSVPEDYSFDLRVLEPNGTIVNISTNQVAIKHSGNLGGPSQLHLEPSPKFTEIDIDPPDPYGVYIVEVVLRDNATKKSLTLRKSFTVEK